MGKPWKPLSEGDIVDLVAPAYSIEPEELKKCEDYIRSLGFTPRVPKDLIGESLLFSNSDDIRYEHLRDALYAEDSQAVWCLKGGYGTARLTSDLAKLDPPENTKLVIGFSDITALHIFLNQCWDWNTVHGPVLWRVASGWMDPYSIKTLKDLIFGESTVETFNLEPLNIFDQTLMDSVIVGGNLTIVQNSIGTEWEVDAKDKILLLEEVDETPYRIDRSLLHLLQADLFKDAKAIIFGDFNGKDVEVNEKEVTNVLKMFAASFDIPILRLHGVGHTPTNNPVPLNTHASLNLGEVCTLSCESGYAR